MFINHIYLIYMNKSDLALNKLQWLICHKTKPNQTKPNQTKCLMISEKEPGYCQGKEKSTNSKNGANYFPDFILTECVYEYIYIFYILLFNLTFLFFFFSFFHLFRHQRGKLKWFVVFAWCSFCHEILQWKVKCWSSKALSISLRWVIHISNNVWITDSLVCILDVFSSIFWLIHSWAFFIRHIICEKKALSFLKERNNHNQIAVSVEPRICWLHSLQRGKTFPSKKKCSVYDPKLHPGVRLKFWSLVGCGVTCSLPLLPGPLWPRVMVSVRVSALGQIELFEKSFERNTIKPYNWVKIIYIKCWHWINHKVLICH